MLAGSKPKQFALLSSSRLLTAVAPILGISFLVKGAGSSAWVAVAVGQAIGAAFVVLVELNWSIMGAGLVGNLRSNEERVVMLRQSFQERVFALVLTVPIAMIVTSVVVHTSQPLAMVSAISGLTLGLSPFWYWAGIGDYGSMLFVEGLTKAALGLMTIVLLEITKCAFVYPVGIILANVSVCIIPLFKHKPFIDFSFAELWKNLKMKSSFTISRLTQSLYVVLPIPILSLISVADLGSYTAIDRLFRFFLTMSLPISQFAQSHVANVCFEQRIVRALKWRKYSLLVGLLSFAGMWLVAKSPLPRILFGSELDSSPSMLAPFVCLSGIISINRIIGQSNLAIFASEKIIARNIQVASFIFFLSFLVAVPILDSAGAAWAMFAAELVSLILAVKWLINSKAKFHV